MTVLINSVACNLIFSMIAGIRCLYFERWLAGCIAIMILPLSSAAQAEPAHCTIQAYGKNVLDQTCDLVVEKDVVKMINGDGSYVSVVADANNRFWATIHAIRDVADPKPVLIPLVKDGDCYRSEDRLSHFCAHKLIQGDSQKDVVESDAKRPCDPTDTSLARFCTRWNGDIGVAIVSPPSDDAQTKTATKDLREYIILHLRQFLDATQQRSAILTSGSANFFCHIR